ncbi:MULTISPECIES: LysR family transcriptional regulator [Glutamicibacter]|uniref:LysR family transcriptional regulator n=1 Tax=Glutamicibacter nicotianae TaxID=37929 RepID=A0ABQ0RI43_GLUNI|nr:MULTISPECIES: LysR family transcriptional regulator [Glutamicibacter]WIV43818.1 LysR family transcriptional regulator [Glutamicibacter nicotianae]GEC11494.1 LysR family transcriptional regulator [Glutamicibacter nicotianae]
MLDAKRLQILLSVVEGGSVTAAADELFYTPSGVSQQLRKLEEEVGQPLLQRHARGMVPTDAGHVLAGHARAILQQMDAAMADLDQLAGLKSGSLSLGTFPTLGSSFIPLVISRFRKMYPSIKLDVRSTRLRELIGLLARGEISMGLLWEYEWMRLKRDDFELTTLFTEPTVLVVGAEHPLAQLEEVDVAATAHEQWIVRANEHPVAELLERTCNAAGFSPKISFQANDYQEAQAMVSVGLGIALAPKSAVVNHHPGVKVLSLGEAAASRSVLLAQRRDRVRAPAENAFQTLLVDMGKTWID